MIARRKGTSLILLLLLALPLALARASRELVPARSSGPKIASSLGFLLSLLSEDIPVDPASSLGQELAWIQASGVIRVSARFAHELSPAEQADIAALGLEFETVAGGLAHLGPFYGLLVPPGAVDDLAAHPLAIWLEATWWPVTPAPLDLSVSFAPISGTWVDAPTVWGFLSPFTGLPLTGQGVTIANFDTGVDVRHPAFLSGTFGPGYSNWDDGDGVFTPGVDQIGGVALQYWDAAGDPFNTPGVLDATQDWVYGDANGSTTYDWDETIYVAYDFNGNNVLDATESLIDRGTLGPGIANSKIAATLDASGVQHTRGVDLDSTAADAGGHGTSVTGILGAGVARWNMSPVWPLARRYTGMAPDADLLVADRFANVPAAYMPWAAGLGAQVMLHELGGWTYTYLDGSSNYEQMMDQAAAQGIVQVVPTGNLHCGTAGCHPRHLQYSVPGAATTNYRFNVPAAMNNLWISLLWLNPANKLTIRLTTATGGAGNTLSLPCATAGSGWQYATTADGHQVGCERAVDSGRGTALYNIWIAQAPIATGNWKMAVKNPGAGPEVTNFYIADDGANAWSFGAGWTTAGGQEKHTATWPSTCDSCLGVASYATRSGTVGALSWFSGRGPRFFDGARVVDVTAPGHFDIITPESQAVSGSVGAYNGAFGGTSAAAPHAAGLAALLCQYANGSVRAAHVSGAIMRGAWSDGFTGGVPNDKWGYGKLQAPRALIHMMSDLGDAPASANNAGQAMDAYPGVAANFPTVYAATVPGPFHWAAGSMISGTWDSMLGKSVSAEGEADTLYDEDTANNIVPMLAQADQDSIDDGLTFPGSLPPCVPISFAVNGSFTGIAAPSPWNRYVNAWADWNADGDWGDVFTCTVSGDAPEWVLQDSPLSFTGASPFNLPFPVMPYRGGDGGDALWIRVSVSEQPAPVDPRTGRADGRGPAGGYAYGETEDYLYPQTDFQAAPSVCVSDTLAFTHDPASSWPVRFDWSFGDGFTMTDPGPDPGHLYTRVGTYTVTLTGTYSASTFSVFTRPVVVSDLPTARFVPGSAQVPVGSPLTFTNTSLGASTYHWDFGDGIGTSTAVNPTYTYTATGVYTVTLMASNTYHCSDVYSDTVRVTPVLYLPLVARSYCP